MTRIRSHIRTNVVAYLALFVALGGTGYAATSLPANSVGANQIRNGVIQRVKFDSRWIDGSVRMWASVSASGKVLAGGAGMSVVASNSGPGDYFVNPSRGSRIETPKGCAVVASVDEDPTNAPGYATAGVSLFRGLRQSWQMGVRTYNASGVPAPLPFDFAVVC